MVLKIFRRVLGGGGGLIETARDSTPVVDDTEGAGAGNWFGTVIQLPLTENFYRITHLEAKFGTGGAGSAILAAFEVDADPPSTSNSQRIIACRTPAFAPVANTTQKIPVAGSYIFSPGAFIYLGQNVNSSSTMLRFITAASQNRRFSEPFTFNPPYARTVNFTATVTELYLKAYIFGYS